MTLSRYVHTGAAPATGLAAGISSSATSFTVLDGTGYPSPTTGQSFVVCIDAGATSEEKILCSARSGTTFTVASGGRGYDGTTAASHSSGTTNVTHVLSAAEVDDTSDHIYTTTRDDHTQYARTDGTRAFTGGITVNSGGAAITGNSTVTGNLTVTGTLSASSSTIAARMYASAGQTITSGATGQINLDTQDFVGATGSPTVSTSGHSMTVNTAGYYLVSAQLSTSYPTNATGPQPIVYLYKNGTAIREAIATYISSNPSGIGPTVEIADVMYLAANDVLTLYGASGNGSYNLVTSSGSAGGCWLTAIRIGG